MAVEQTVLASAVIGLAGGVDNIVSAGRCLVRLRLRLVDPALADLDAIRALPGVSIAIRSAGELHVAPSAGLEELHATVAAVVASRS
ncbi:PTS transporter subunit EIIB [Demequina mangrovi]|uniref:Phosphotransferase system, EIIB n=1 Tax=Demequina mangrovi TaxID=1043493 RepID=A0A1H6U669_9MICO|nr:PTS transporter subunit EIIB [Demequina mangrovi]SEI87813.1 phosphotransferase system, EIIB [Demequina mangrovi]